jgi:TRAP-type C4-dicarboxylate transport system permease small subunit
MRLIRGALGAISVLLLLSLVAMPALQIVLRDLFISPIVGLEELTRMAMVLMVFAAYPLVVDAGENILMGEAKAALPARARRRLEVAIAATCAAAAAVMVWAVAEALAANPRNMTPTLKIPFWIFLAATGIGLGGAGIMHLWHLRRPQPAPLPPA